MTRSPAVRRTLARRQRPRADLLAIGAAALVTLVATGVAIARQLDMSRASDTSEMHHESGTALMPPLPMPDGEPPRAWQLYGMPLSDMPEMWISGVGILVIVAVAVARGRPLATTAPPGRWGRATLPVILTLALTIDISKTSTLGFVIPGMRAEYGLGPQAASLLAVAGLTGTAAGALLCAVATDRLGPRLTYLICTLTFAATSTCGSMPTFGGNLVMCALMGLSVGGLAPLMITLLSDALPEDRRGPLTTCLSLAALAAGFLVAASTALWLEPLFGWRVLWLIGAPTGILLVLAVPLVPRARGAGTDAARQAAPAHDHRPRPVRALPIWIQGSYATIVGLVGFGLTTWLPTLTRAVGLDVTAANRLLVLVSLGTLPLACLLVVSYPRIGPGRLLAWLSIASAALLGVLVLSGAGGGAGWIAVASLALSLFAVNCMTAVFLPVAADLSRVADRARTTGMISLCNRIGGLAGPLLLAGLVASVDDVLTFVALASIGCALLSLLILRRVRRNAGRAAVT